MSKTTLIFRLSAITLVVFSVVLMFINSSNSVYFIQQALIASETISAFAEILLVFVALPTFLIIIIVGTFLN